MKKKTITGLVITIAVFAAVILFSIYFFSNNNILYDDNGHLKQKKGNKVFKNKKNNDVYTATYYSKTNINLLNFILLLVCKHDCLLIGPKEIGKGRIQ